MEHINIFNIACMHANIVLDFSIKNFDIWSSLMGPKLIKIYETSQRYVGYYKYNQIQLNMSAIVPNSNQKVTAGFSISIKYI